MDWKKGVDLSNFVLLEDTADSLEAEVVPDLDEAHAAEAAIAGDHDDDDLQDAESSCCCGSANDYKLGFSKVFDCHDDQDSNGVSNFGNDEDDDECREKSTNSCCETSMSEDVGLECNISEEEEKEIGKFNNMDEMEDRLFWETCMAEGYP